MRKQKSIFLACIVAIAARLSCFTLGAAGSHGHWAAVTVLIVVTQFCVAPQNIVIALYCVS